MLANSKKTFQTKILVITSMMCAVTIVLMVTPIGTIKLPVVSITIAHVPVIITAIVLGLREGLVVAFALGVSSLVMAITSPGSILDPFFINPLVSILPRMLIAVTTYFSYKIIKNPLKKVKAGEHLAAAVSVVIGNLTNTFGVYTMLYLIYARQIFEKTGKEALGFILASISTTTAIKCIAVVIIVTPVIYALNKINRQKAQLY